MSTDGPPLTDDENDVTDQPTTLVPVLPPPHPEEDACAPNVRGLALTNTNPPDARASLVATQPHASQQLVRGQYLSGAVPRGTKGFQHSSGMPIEQTQRSLIGSSRPARIVSVGSDGGVSQSSQYQQPCQFLGSSRPAAPRRSLTEQYNCMLVNGKTVRARCIEHVLVDGKTVPAPQINHVLIDGKTYVAPGAGFAGRNILPPQHGAAGEGAGDERGPHRNMRSCNSAPNILTSRHDHNMSGRIPDPTNSSARVLTRSFSHRDYMTNQHSTGRMVTRFDRPGALQPRNRCNSTPCVIPKADIIGTLLKMKHSGGLWIKRTFCIHTGNLCQVRSSGAIQTSDKGPETLSQSKAQVRAANRRHFIALSPEVEVFVKIVNDRRTSTPPRNSSAGSPAAAEAAGATLTNPALPRDVNCVGKTFRIEHRKTGFRRLFKAKTNNDAAAWVAVLRKHGCKISPFK